MSWGWRRNSCDGIYSDSLDVRFTKACDNACAFCIEQSGLPSLGASQVEPMIAATIASHKTTVLILGGEPFLYPAKLREYISGIRAAVSHIYVTTSIPWSLNPADPAVAEILAAIDGLNVSLHHYDPALNNAILVASRPFDRMARLAELLADPAIAAKTRVSVNLVRGQIDSRAAIDTYLERLAAIGARQVKLNELQEVGPELYVSFERAYGCRLPSPYSGGCQTDISTLFADRLSRPLRVTLKRSCFLVSPVPEASLSDLVKVAARRIRPLRSQHLVLYEDGSLSDGWISGPVSS